jgi:hypothetical protein
MVGQQMEPPFSRRAEEIASGLVRSGRASAPRKVHDHIELRANRGGGFYWITIDGSRLLRGDDLDTAEELQPNFAQAMAQAGKTAWKDRKRETR